MKVVLKPERVESTANYYGGITMSSSIDLGTLTVGALIGIGCRKQIKAASRVAANLASSLATSAAIAVNSAAAEMDGAKIPQVGQAGNGQKKNG